MRLKVSWAFVSYWILGVENKIKKNIETNQNNNSEQLKKYKYSFRDLGLLNAL